ncbi:MAG: tetratricopeptide repeat protein [Chthoniobacterales bacterium]
MKSVVIYLLCMSLLLPASVMLSAPPKSEANALAVKGTEAAKNRQWDEAINDLRKATEMDKKYARSLVAALLGRAATYASQQQYQQAAADYDEVLKLEPKNTTAIEGRGSMAMKLNDMDKAVAMYSEAIKVDPKEIRYLQYRSYIYEVKGDLKNSMADNEKVLKLDKTNADALARKARIEARQAQAQSEQFPPVPQPQGSPRG